MSDSGNGKWECLTWRMEMSDSGNGNGIAFAFISFVLVQDFFRSRIIFCIV